MGQAGGPSGGGGGGGGGSSSFSSLLSGSSGGSGFLNLGSEQTLSNLAALNIFFNSGYQTILNRQTGLVVFLNLQAIGVPLAPSLSSTVAGALAGTTYYVKTTYVSAGYESAPSPQSSLAVAANSVLVVNSPADWPPANNTGIIGNSADSYNVYVSTSSGTETLQNSTPIALGTAWTEPTTGLVTGVSPPSATQGLLLKIQGFDLSNEGFQYTALLSSNPITATGRYSFGIGPLPWAGVTQGLNQDVPDRWQVSVTPVGASDLTSYLYSVTYIPF